jgi:hypothetical protein
MPDESFSVGVMEKLGNEAVRRMVSHITSGKLDITRFKTIR